MKKLLLILILICYATKGNSQFVFSGNINDEYINATAYLALVEDYKKSDQFIAENVLAQSKIDKYGVFTFSGNFLNTKDNIYKIYIDNCNENIGNAKHLLNNCPDHRSINFIANNTDTIHFPLNNLDQMLCDFSYNRKENTYIKQLDSLQEYLLIDLENTINDAQRKLIYKNYFNNLKDFSTTLDHPLAELYAFNLYANENSFSRDYYLDDLKRSDYYNNLGDVLLKNDLTHYAKDLNRDLLVDNSSFEKNRFNLLHYALFGLLFLSLLCNYFLFKRTKKIGTITPLNYLEVLTKQEQRVFEEMHSGLSNKAIADKLFVSLSTVKTHINSIYSKLDISSRKDIEKFF